MNLEFIKIEIQNFKSVGELVTFNYEDLKGLNFIFGKNMDVPNAKNGSGKSCLAVDSLVFALFGRTLKNTNNKYIPNRSMPTTLKPYVKVYFRSNGQLYSCETYGRVVGKIMSTTGMELLKLNDDYSVAEDITQSSIAKTKQYIIDNLLGCTFNIFRSSIVMTSSDFTNFYEGMSKDQKRKYVESIFNLDCFGEMYNMIKTNLNDTKKEMTMLKNSLISLTQKIETMKEKSDNFEKDRKNRQDEIKDIIISRSESLKKLIVEADSVDVEDSKDILSKQEDLIKKIQELTDEKTNKEKAVIKLESNITHSKQMIEKMKSITEGLCKDCTQLINKRYNYDSAESDMKNGKAKIEDLNSSIEDLTASIKSNKDQMAKINSQLSEMNEKKSKKDGLTMKINSTKMELKNLKEKYDELNENSLNPFEDILKGLETDKEDSISRLNEYNKNYKHLDILKEACSENGIKKFIIKDIVKLLNSQIQKYLNEIGCEFIVYFDETFEFKFITTTGECEFSNFSAGEKQRIQIATLLAFRDLILNGKVSSNIFIIDELLDANVDTACIDNVMNILKRKAEEAHQNIFIISHRSELADNMSFWNNIIKVTKENQQSRYEII